MALFERQPAAPSNCRSISAAKPPTIYKCSCEYAVPHLAADALLVYYQKENKRRITANSEAVNEGGRHGRRHKVKRAIFRL